MPKRDDAAAAERAADLAARRLAKAEAVAMREHLDAAANSWEGSVTVTRRADALGEELQLTFVRRAVG